MTQRILAVGCSFTAGYELTDPLQAWPYLVADQLGGSCCNLAQPAAANAHIVRTIAEQINHYDTFLIGWTGYDRLEFADDLGIWSTWPGRPAQAGDRALVSRYLTLNHDVNYLYRSYLTSVIAVQSMLALAGRRWVMIDAFLNDEDPGRLDPVNQDLVSQIAWSHWVPGNMYRWTQHLDHGPGGHPLQQGHQLTSEIIYENALHLRR
jgi:hypothetical protein